MLKVKKDSNSSRFPQKKIFLVVVVLISGLHMVQMFLPPFNSQLGTYHVCVTLTV